MSDQPSFEDRLARIERVLFGDERTCSCGAPRINEHWCSGGHYHEHWNQPPERAATQRKGKQG